MPFYQILKMWFIPPGIFIVLFLALALYFAFCAYMSKKAIYSNGAGLYRSLGVGAALCCLCAIITYGISVHAGSARLLRSLEYAYPRENIKPDAILVLGGDDGRRELMGAKLYQRYKVELVVSGHNGEANRMKKVLLSKQVPENKIIEEPLATNTRDHVKYILPIAKERGYKKVYLVTSAYHMPRSMKNFYEPFKVAGIEVVPYASSYSVSKKHYVIPCEWTPDIVNLQQSALAWHEYLGLLELWLRGM